MPTRSVFTLWFALALALAAPATAGAAGPPVLDVRSGATASGINDQGQVVGISGSGRAFVWTQAHGTVDLGKLRPSDSLSSARAINDAGQVVGSSGDAYGDRAFSWTQAGGMRDLGKL